MVKNLQCRRPGFDSWFGKIPWRRKQQDTSVFLPRESHGQRSLAGYCPWCYKSQTRQRLNNHLVLRLSQATASLIPHCVPLCPILCDPLDHSPPGFSVHEIFQARILEWVAIFLLQGIFPTQGQTHISCVSCIAGGFFIC